MTQRHLQIFSLAVLIGILIILQIRSFGNVTDVYLRDSASNAFQEIKILKVKNTSLRNEIKEIEDFTGQLSNQSSALAAINEEIKKYRKLSGNYGVFGPGITIVIENKQLYTPWVTDMVNDLFNSGAEAVSVNGIRIVNSSAGFDTLPLGQILLNGSILTSPYVFESVGEPTKIIEFLELPGGIFDRLEAGFPGIIINVAKREVLQLN